MMVSYTHLHHDKVVCNSETQLYAVVMCNVFIKFVYLNMVATMKATIFFVLAVVFQPYLYVFVQLCMNYYY